jgi:hypothetical protein
MARKQNNRLRRRGVNAKGRTKGGERYVKLDHYLLKSPAWRSLSPGAKCLLIEVWQRHNGINNGEISYSVREAAKSLRCSKNTAAKWFQELVERGILKPRQPGSFTYKKRHATEWEITAEQFRGKPASKDFMRWKPPDETQNPVPVRGTDGPSQRDRRMHEEAKINHHAPDNPATVPLRGTVTTTHGPTERDTSIIPCGFRGNGSDDKGNDADLLAIPECFDRRPSRLAKSST